MIFIPDSDTQAGREGDHGQEDDAELGVGLEGGEHAEQTAPLRASHNCLSSSLQRPAFFRPPAPHHSFLSRAVRLDAAQYFVFTYVATFT